MLHHSEALSGTEVFNFFGEAGIPAAQESA